MRRVLLGRAVALALLAGLPAGSAHADELMLSNDGVTWHTDLDGGLFGGTRPWVPGESRTGQLLVRNSTSSPGTLSLQLTGPQSVALTHRILVRARIASQPWSEQRALPYRQQLPIGSVEGQAERVVLVRVTLDPSARRASAGSTADLGITFRLVQAPVTDAAIPRAGAQELRIWTVAGGLLVGLGLWLVIGGRRHRGRSR